jgi:phosphate-selective porin
MKLNTLRGLVAALVLLLTLFTGFLAADDQNENPPLTTTVPLKVTGYTQARFGLVNDDYSSLFNNSGPSTFHLYRARLGLEGEIFKGIRYRFQFEAARTPMLLDAMIEFSLVKDGYARVGQFKVPFSQENLISDVYLDTINLSQVVNKLCPARDIGSNGRDIGALADYRYRTVEATVAVLNGSGINKADPDSKKDIALRATWSPFDYLSVGVSEYIGHTIAATTTSPIYKRDRTGLELAVNYDRYMLKGEYIYAVDNTKDASGFYIMGGYFILPKKLQVLVRYDTLDPDLNLTGNRSTICLAGLNWFFTKKTKFEVNLELGKLEGQNLVFSALLGQFQVGF